MSENPIVRNNSGGQVEIVSPGRRSWLNSHAWEENIPCPMSRADIEKLQREIDDILGVEPDGTHRMRIVWGQDGKIATVFDRYNQTERVKYLWKTNKKTVLNPATGLFESRLDFIGIPRLWIEAYIPPVHNQSLVGTVEAGEHFDEDNILVGADQEVGKGQYIPATAIVQHSMLEDKSGWRVCCLAAIKAEHKCWGDYREVDGYDIDQIRIGLADRMNAKLTRPDHRITPHDKELAYLDFVNDSLQNWRRQTAEMAYRRQHTLKTIEHWADGGPNRKGKFAYGFGNPTNK